MIIKKLQLNTSLLLTDALMIGVGKKVNNSIHTNREISSKLIPENAIYTWSILRDKDGFIYDQHQNVNDQIFFQNQWIKNSTVFDLLVIIDKFKFNFLNTYFQQFKSEFILDK